MMLMARARAMLTKASGVSTKPLSIFSLCRDCGEKGVSAAWGEERSPLPTAQTCAIATSGAL